MTTITKTGISIDGTEASWDQLVAAATQCDAALAAAYHDLLRSAANGTQNPAYAAGALRRVEGIEAGRRQLEAESAALAATNTAAADNAAFRREIMDLRNGHHRHDLSDENIERRIRHLASEIRPE